ncbi:MAG: class I SAM-dependent methyltransferase [Hyphomicrobiaceae bacterium]
MSRLDSMIRRLTAQRLCLNMACELIAPVEGVILEVGLGNGRTYDHLREKLPGREIFVFDRAIHSHPDCRPDAEHALLGDVVETLPEAAKRFAGRVALVHSDIGNGIAEYGATMARAISAALPGALAKGAIVLSDEPLDIAGTEPLEPPPLVDLRRYFLYRRV